MLKNRKDELFELACILLNLVPYIGGATSQAISSKLTEKKINQLENLIEHIALDIDKSKIEIADNYLKSDDFKEIFRQSLTEFSKEKNPQTKAFYQNFITHLILTSGDRFCTLKHSLESIAKLYGHGVIGRAHIFRHLMNDELFIEKWLRPAEVSKEELNNKLEGTLNLISKSNQVSQIKLSSSSFKIIRDAVNIFNTIPNTDINDCLWASLREQTHLLQQISINLLPHSNKVWIRFINDVKNLNSIMFSGTPYSTE